MDSAASKFIRTLVGEQKKKEKKERKKKGCNQNIRL